MHTAPHTVSCPLLIGRDEVLELADRRIDDVIADRGQFLLLAGQAGIGKTRLLGAIRRQAEARDFVATDGALAPQDHDVPAASILDLARTMTRQPPFADLGRDLLDLCEAAMDAEHAQRRRLVSGFVERILGSLPGPTLLAFEDLQWADDVSLEVIAELARRSRDRPLLLVGDYRTEDVLPGCEPARLAIAAHHPTDRRGDPARPADPDRDGARDHADPRYRAPGAARRGGRGVRPDGRDPAPHRGAPRRDECRGAGGRDRHPRSHGSGHDRGRGHRPDRAALAGGPGDRSRRGGDRSLLRAGGPRGDHGRSAGHAGGAAAGAGRQRGPRPARRARALRLPPPAASRRPVPHDPGLGAPPVPCSSRRVRGAARRRFGDPRIRPLRTCRASPPGVRRRARGGPRHGSAVGAP